jgi:hypothetical protein
VSADEPAEHQQHDGDVEPDAEVALPAGLAALLADPATWGAPSPGLADRVVAAVTMAATTATTLGPGADVVPLSAARRRWRGPVAAVAAAAAAAALVGVVVHRADRADQLADPDVSVVLSRVDAVDASAADEAPGAAGTAGIRRKSSGVQIDLSVPGLPRREGQEFYEGWLRSCDGSAVVPIGTFHDLSDAIGWAGVSIDAHPIISVTREVAVPGDDPGQESSGDVVLRGELAPCG